MPPRTIAVGDGDAPGAFGFGRSGCIVVRIADGEQRAFRLARPFDKEHQGDDRQTARR
jgi:hypothetical protein